ncbi:MAG TPA: hypothetical protein VG650_13475 [Mycobacteriales bacterium]|nr:hypothetical protein [Mycobacteriales bacterium]
MGVGDTGTPPGVVQYLAEIDALTIQFFPGGIIPKPLTGRFVEFPEMGLIVTGQWDDEGRLYAIAVAQASQHVPRALFKNPSGAPLTVVAASDEPGTAVLGLFPGALNAVSYRMAWDLFDGGDPIDILLAKSRKIVAFCIPNAADRLPDSFPLP